MKTILVPLNFGSSKDCKSTLLYALNLARIANLRVVVFHAFSPDVFAADLLYDPAAVLEKERAKAKELEKYVNTLWKTCSSDLILSYSSTVRTGNEKLFHHHVTRSGFHTLQELKEIKFRKPVKVTCVSKMGDVYEQIMCASFAYDPDLLVMGIPGSNSRNQPLTGSITLAVMRHSNVPVLGVPKGIRFTKPKSVVFASDLLKVPDPLMLQKLRNLIRGFKWRLHVLHLHQNKDLQAECDKAQVALEALDQQLFDINFNVIFHQRENLDAGIREYMVEQKADMLVLCPYRHTFIDRLFNKSLTQRITAKATVPLLALPTRTYKATDAGSGQAAINKTGTV